MKFEEVIFTQKAYHHKPTFLPTRATAKSAGHDFFLKEDVTINPGKAVFQYTERKIINYCPMCCRKLEVVG